MKIEHKEQGCKETKKCREDGVFWIIHFLVVVGLGF